MDGKLSKHAESGRSTSGVTNVLLNGFGTQFLTVAPPLLNCDDELIWLDLTNPAFHKPVYNSFIKESKTLGKDAKYLITQSFKQALSIQDQNDLLRELEKDPQLVYNVGLTPDKVFKIIPNELHILSNIFSASRFGRVQSSNCNRNSSQIDALS